MKPAYSLNAYRRFSVTEAVERIGRLGFAGVEIMADAPHLWPADATAEDADAIRRTVADCGLAVSNVNAFMMTAVGDFWHPSWIDPESNVRRQRIEHTIRAITLARRLGAKHVSTEPGGPLPEGVSREAATACFVEGLNEALARAEQEGVMLLVEPEPGLLIETVADFERLASMISSPWFGLNFDIGHFYCVNEDLPQAVRRLARWTRHYHVEDIAATRVHHHLIPGCGAIGFADVLSAIRETGYDGWLTVELYPYLDDPDDAGRRALFFLNQLMDG